MCPNYLLRNFILCLLVILLIFFLGLFLAINPITAYYVTKEIKKISGADTVSIRDVHVHSLNSIDFDDVTVGKKNGFNLFAKRISVVFYPWLIVRGASPDLCINELYLSDISVGDGSGKIKLEKGSLVLNQNAPGSIFIEKILWDKAVLSDLKSVVIMGPKRLLFQHITGQTLSGSMDGELSVNYSENPLYRGNFKFNNLDMADMVDTFRLGTKVAILGLVSGRLVLEGKGSSVKILDGDFLSGKQGGSIVIKDAQFLKNFAKTNQQSSDLIIESLKNYRYNDGIIKLTIKEGVVLLEVNLNGDNGKRNFQIGLHNFI